MAFQASANIKARLKDVRILAVVVACMFGFGVAHLVIPRGHAPSSMADAADGDSGADSLHEGHGEHGHGHDADASADQHANGDGAHDEHDEHAGHDEQSVEHGEDAGGGDAASGDGDNDGGETPPPGDEHVLRVEDFQTVRKTSDGGTVVRSVGDVLDEMIRDYEASRPAKDAGSGPRGKGADASAPKRRIVDASERPESSAAQLKQALPPKPAH